MRKREIEGLLVGLWFLCGWNAVDAHVVVAIGLIGQSDDVAPVAAGDSVRAWFRHGYTPLIFPENYLIVFMQLAKLFCTKRITINELRPKMPIERS